LTLKRLASAVQLRPWPPLTNPFGSNWHHNLQRKGGRNLPDFSADFGPCSQISKKSEGNQRARLHSKDAASPKVSFKKQSLESARHSGQA